MNDQEEQSEPLGLRFEKALDERHPFFLPVIFMIIGIALFFLLWYVSLADILANHPALDPFALLEYPLEVDYWTISVIFIAGIVLVMLAVYFVALIPLTLFLLAASKGMVFFGLSQDQAQIGEKFGGIQLVLRSMLPGLFGIGVGVTGIRSLFAITNVPPESWPFSFTVIMVLYYGVIGMILGMALFPATWFGDDSGLVIHGFLGTPYRAPPKVDGIGNWMRALFAGLALFLYPLVMIQNFILSPFLSGSLSFLDFILAFLMTVVAMPIAMIGLSIPFVLLTERLRPRVAKQILRLAKRMGAKSISFHEPTKEET